MNYEIITIDGVDIVQGTGPDGIVWNIPMDPANSDYQAYLASLEETA